MPGAPTYFTFRYTRIFEASAKGLLTDEELRVAEQAITEDPEAGTLIVGAGGARKMRLALPGRGKSGGARIVYYVRGEQDVVYMLFAYAKGKKEGLTREEENALKQIVKALKRED